MQFSAVHKLSTAQSASGIVVLQMLRLDIIGFLQTLKKTNRTLNSEDGSEANTFTF